MDEARVSGNRLGLCLSGGGFRAALYHIGTLAALAERGLLHQVEVLSCVSGGSIIGAYYYLKVKQLLEGKRPGQPQPTPAIYRQIVQEIEDEFLAAVQKNLRLRLFGSFAANRKLADKDYSRSDRVADLLDALFYRDLAGVPDLRLKDIYIRPGGVNQPAFEYNADHEYKIPVLVLNATCLNTGHPWHFTGAWVGEPDDIRAYVRGIDTNYRLPRLSLQSDEYRDGSGRKLDDTQQRKLESIRLADAVAASAAVPGLFPPLAIHDLYRTPQGREIVVRLSDGGVYDNQGVDALYTYLCTRIIVSDAAGQIEDVLDPSARFYAVIQRSNDTMMAKIRAETLYRVEAGRQAAGVLPPPFDAENRVHARAVTHLRQAFANSPDFPNFPPPVHTNDGMVYRLSGLRTDLDSFSDAEAYALMYDGYCLAQERLDPDFPSTADAPGRSADWRFLQLRRVLEAHTGRVWLQRRLAVGKNLFFKPYMLATATALLTLALPLLLVLALLGLGGYWGVCAWQGLPDPAYGGLCSPASIRFFEWGGLGVRELGVAFIGLLLLLPGLAGVRAALADWAPVRALRRNPLVSFVAGVGFALAMLAVSIGFSWYRRASDRIFLKDGRLP